MNGTYPFHDNGQQNQDEEEHYPLLSCAHKSYFSKKKTLLFMRENHNWKIKMMILIQTQNDN